MNSPIFAKLLLFTLMVHSVLAQTPSYQTQLIKKLLDPSVYDPIVTPTNAGLPNGTFRLEI
jgi:hypothetical protein